MRKGLVLHKGQLAAVKQDQGNFGTIKTAKSAFALWGQRDRFSMEQY